MKRLLLPLAFILLAGCTARPVETKEYSCAPQNIQYDSTLNRLVCIRAGAVSEDIEPIRINCVESSYKQENGDHSCLDSERVLHVMKPITFTSEETFAHKQECQKLLPQIEKRLKEEEEGTSTFTSIDKLFYSVSMNSCLYTSTSTTRYRDSEMTFIGFSVSDALTGQLLLHQPTQVGSETYQRDRDQFAENLKVYE